MRTSAAAPAPVRPFAERTERAPGRAGEALISSLGLPLACGVAVIGAVGRVLGAARARMWLEGVSPCCGRAGG